MSATTCPACGQPVPLPRGYQGGPVTCSSPKCGAVFEPPASRLAPGGVARPTARPPGSPPELLDRLELSVLASPPMLLVGGVVALLYGMVLFAVVSGGPRPAAEPEPAPEPSPVAVARAEPASEPATPVRPAEPPPAAEAKAKATAPAESKKAAASAETPTTKASPPAAPKAMGTAVAEAKPAPKAAPAAANAWGPLTGDPGDCTFRPDARTLGILIPATLHILSPDLGVRNAPRLLTDVTGDFVAQVKVVGRILPGTDPLPNLPLTFQGGGLLLWQDADHYLRLERTASYNPAEGKKYHQVLAEFCRDGKVTSTLSRSVTEGDVMLQFDRRGNEVRCRYSPDDGKTWLELKRPTVNFPAKVSVGVAAANASPKPFTVVFEDFRLTPAGARGAGRP